MSDRIRCSCPRCTLRGLMGPAIIVTIGVLFLLSEMRGGFFDFSNTWPVILIVVGFLSLGSAMAPMTGHVSPPPGGYPVPPPIPPASSGPQGATQPPPFQGQGQ
jgi:hypothetical protein